MTSKLSGFTVKVKYQQAFAPGIYYKRHKE